VDRGDVRARGLLSIELSEFSLVAVAVSTPVGVALSRRRTT